MLKNHNTFKSKNQHFPLLVAMSCIFMFSACSTSKYQPSLGDGNTNKNDHKKVELNDDLKSSSISPSTDTSDMLANNETPTTTSTSTLNMQPDSTVAFMRKCITSVFNNEEKDSLYFVRNNISFSIILRSAEKTLQLTETQPLKKDFPLTREQVDQLISTGKISLNFSGLPDGEYLANITGINYYDSGVITLKNGLFVSSSQPVPVVVRNLMGLDDLSICDDISNFSPLVIAVNNEKIEATSISDGVDFDMDGDGIKEQMAWIDNPENSMFLVYDKNNNGNIDNINEMFGNFTVGPDQKTTTNGFLALAKYDLNNDGVIDEKDAIFGELRLWSDLNKNGLTDEGELFTLEEKSIAAINLIYNDVKEIDANDNEIRQKSTVRLANNELLEIVDLWFSYLTE